MQIEDELKRALRPEDPGAEFTERVVARALAGDSPGQSADAHASRTVRVAGVPARATPAAWRQPRQFRRLLAAAAASIALAAAGAQWVQHRIQVTEGKHARAQVLAALRLTSEQLQRVHDALPHVDRR